MKRLCALVLLLAAVAVSAGAQTPSDLPREHWAYTAVSELASKGYVLGYADGNFLGDRTLSRYEFATIVKRTLDGVKAVCVAGKVEASGLSADDLDKLNKLVGEFKVELAIIGVNVEAVMPNAGTSASSSDSLKETVDKLDAIITDPEGALESTRADVSKLKKVAVSGYVQARYTTFENDPDQDTANGPRNNFSVRRARLKVVGKPTDNSSATIQLDAGQNFTGASAPAVSLKDAYLTYAFSGDPLLGYRMQMGQMKWPFGYEVLQSSSARETPERSLVIQRFFPGERDRGFYVGSPTGAPFNWVLGVFNGVGAGNKEFDNSKDAVGSVRHKIGDLDFGLSAYIGRRIVSKDSSASLPFDKTRYGADVEWYLNDLSLKAEYVTGKGVDKTDPTKFDPNTSINGYWAQAAYNFTKANTFVAKYETLSQDPLYPTLGRRSAWNLGLLRWLDDKTRVKFFYIINKESQHSFGNNTFLTEWITVF